VFRLERLAPDAQLSTEDLVVCNVPGWQFDFGSLEELHRQLEELRLEHDNLNVQYSRTKEILISLNASVEANEASELSPQRRAGESSSRLHRREVEQLRMQLTQSEKKQQETKATVMALRNEFMHLVDVMQSSGHPKCQVAMELPQVMKELDTNSVETRKTWTQASSEGERLRGGNDCGGGNANAADAAKRHVSQPAATTPGARRPVGPGMGSPRVYRVPGSFTTPRPGARPRGVHQRSGHSAGAHVRTLRSE
jgi:hypothetical protein